jgi:hypothetical protein
VQTCVPIASPLPQLVNPTNGATNVVQPNGQLALVFDFFQPAAGNWVGPVVTPAVTAGPFLGPMDPGPNGQLTYVDVLSSLAAHTTYKVGFAPPSTALCDARPVIFIGSFTTQ